VKAGWSLKLLGDVCDRKPSKAEARRRLADSDKVSFVPMNELGIHQKYFEATETRPLSAVAGSYTYFADGDVLLAKITPCFENGKLGIAQGLENGIGFGSSEFMVLRPKPDLLSEYLYYFLDQEPFREIGAKAMTGAVGHKRIPSEFVEALQIPIPSLDEQRRIVAVLDKAFAGIATATANAQKNLTNAGALFESYLASAYDKASATCSPVPLSELATDITDGDHMPPPKSEMGVPFITIGNIDKRTRKINFDETFRVSPGYFNALKSNRKPRQGDILFTVTGSFGIPVLIEDDVEFCFQRHIGLIRPKPNVDSRWLSYIILSPQVFEQANSGATGTAQKTVSLKVLRNIIVPRVEYADQCSAVIELDALANESDRLESTYMQKLAALTELKQSLLQKAFAGELT
jgi:type I restriction enzyme S subunit